MKESPAIFIKPTSHASKKTRNRIKEHGREGFIDAGDGVIILMNGVPYADVDSTCFDSVEHPTCGFWINNNEWEKADNG